MPTSVFCRRSKAAGQGFTLLELLIVLALMGLAVAVVTPRLVKTYGAIVSSGDRAEMVRQIERLPVIARDRGEALTIASPADWAALHLQFPAGWRALAVTPLRVERSGVCHEGRIDIDGPDGRERWLLTEPSCEVRDASP